MNNGGYLPASKDFFVGHDSYTLLKAEPASSCPHNGISPQRQPMSMVRLGVVKEMEGSFIDCGFHGIFPLLKGQLASLKTQCENFMD